MLKKSKKKKSKGARDVSLLLREDYDDSVGIRGHGKLKDFEIEALYASIMGTTFSLKLME